MTCCYSTCYLSANSWFTNTTKECYEIHISQAAPLALSQMVQYWKRHVMLAWACGKFPTAIHWETCSKSKVHDTCVPFILCWQDDYRLCSVCCCPLKWFWHAKATTAGLNAQPQNVFSIHKSTKIFVLMVSACVLHKSETGIKVNRLNKVVTPSEKQYRDE